MLVDAHIHITDDDLFILKEQILLMLEKLDIIAISVSMDLETAKRNMEIKSKMVLPFIGIHPWSIDEDLDKFIEFAKVHIDRVYGIGEIGLDRKYAKDDEEYEKQKRIFEAMLELSSKYNKPISVHSRGSVDDILAILSSYDLNVLLHWFSGSKKQLRIANDKGYYVSYGPALLYASDKPNLLLDSEKTLILAETDGPVRYPKCFGMRITMPSYLISVVYAISNILKLDYADACELLTKNSLRYLGKDTIK